VVQSLQQRSARSPPHRKAQDSRWQSTCSPARYPPRTRQVERFLLGRAAGEPAGQIQRTELDRKAPMQDVNVASQRRAKLAGDGIKPKIGRDAAGRMLQDDGASNAKWSQPRQTVRRIAKALAEKQSRLDRVRRFGADAQAPEFPMPQATLAKATP
jgi:hypothetical protein